MCRASRALLCVMFRAHAARRQGPDDIRLSLDDVRLPLDGPRLRSSTPRLNTVSVRVVRHRPRVAQ
jgi:hypothetical protein